MAWNTLRPGKCRAEVCLDGGEGGYPVGGDRLADDGPDLVDRVGLVVDRQQRWRLGQVHRTDGTLDARGNADGLAVVVGPGGGQGVLAVRPLRAVVALAVPAEGLVGAGGDRVAVGV